MSSKKAPAKKPVAKKAEPEPEVEETNEEEETKEEEVEEPKEEEETKEEEAKEEEEESKAEDEEPKEEAKEDEEEPKSEANEDEEETPSAKPTKKQEEKPKMITPAEFDIKGFSYPPIKENKPEYRQYTSFPVYKYKNGTSNKLVMQTDWIHLNKYGVPKKTDKNNQIIYDTDEKRSFIKIPLDEKNPSSVELCKALEAIDKKVKTAGLKELTSSSIYVKKKATKPENFSYQALVKLPEEKVNEETGQPYPRTKYVKLMLDNDYKTKTIKTIIYHQKGKVLEEQEDITSMTDVEEKIPYNSKIKMIISAFKFYAAKTKNADGKYLFGIKFKILSILVILGEGRAGGNNRDYGFSDTGDFKMTKGKKAKPKQQVEDDEEAPAEEEEEVKPKKPTKPAPKVAPKKPVKKPEPEEEEAEAEEEEKPKKSVKKDAKAKPKPKKPSDEDELALNKEEANEDGEAEAEADEE